MAGLVETDQHGSRSRSGGRNHDSNRSRTTRKGAREREARKKLEAKRRTARPNFRPRLGSARHEGQAEAHAPWSGVIWGAQAASCAPPKNALATRRAIRHLER